MKKDKDISPDEVRNLVDKFREDHPKGFYSFYPYTEDFINNLHSFCSSNGMRMSMLKAFDLNENFVEMKFNDSTWMLSINETDRIKVKSFGFLLRGSDMLDATFLVYPDTTVIL